LALQLASHFVAFIDILGFSEMVRSDCESSNSPKHLELLYDSHVRASALLGKDLETGLIQFSDSIVFSRPFDLPSLGGFISAVATLQRSMFCDGLLCRGGITFGKHFVKDRFMFSKGLIDAYHLESLLAKYPRIVVSENLLELANPTIDIAGLKVMREEDGVAFVDYLSHNKGEDEDKLVAVTQKIIADSKDAGAAVQEKMRWLARYADHKLGSHFSGPRFKVL
jgi:hypothetical protein